MRRNDNPTNLITHIISSADDPLFAQAYTVLNNYFGSRNEMESAEVIESRFAWAADKINNDFSLLYQLAYITDEQEDLAAVGDYSVIIKHSACQAGQALIVHLSHIWVNPQKPGRGVVKHLMHSLTINAAKQAMQQAKLSPNTPIILVGEMEPYTEGNEERIRRIKVFLYNGLRLVDPELIKYYQPDFRSQEDIAKQGKSSPVHLSLMVRRVEREEEEQTSASEIKHIAHCLYHMYAQGLCHQAIQDAYLTLDNYPPDNSPVKLFKRLPQEK